KGLETRERKLCHGPIRFERARASGSVHVNGSHRQFVVDRRITAVGAFPDCHTCGRVDFGSVRRSYPGRRFLSSLSDYDGGGNLDIWIPGTMALVLRRSQILSGKVGVPRDDRNLVGDFASGLHV